MNVPTFDCFCNSWVDFCLTLLNNEEISKQEKNKIKGEKFKEEFHNILQAFIPNGFRMVLQKKIRGANYKYDFLLVNSDCLDFFDIEPLKVLAAFKVKSHGFYSYADIKKTKDAFQEVKKLNRNVRLFYITFRETNTYDNKVKEIFDDCVQDYYRLSDSGNGVQLPPKRYFPDAWDKLIGDLKSINSVPKS